MVQAIDLMMQFADRVGLTSDHPPRRYLWTDAFAVTNLLGLERATGDVRYAELALHLVDRVHDELGKHREDDPRTGWLSGLPGESAEAHPTRGGLRIGKPMPERASNETLDPDVEWSRDGQYFHYLMKWVHALDQLSRASGREDYHLWARELAVVAYRAFTVGPIGAKRMVCKLSIDLAKPVVASEGQHDPLDGLVTCMQLDATARQLGAPMSPRLTAARADYAAMLDLSTLTTSGPLGVGGLLVAAYRLAQIEPIDQTLVAALLETALDGLEHITEDVGARASFRHPARELGLAIGLAAVPLFEGPFDEHVVACIAELARHAPLAAEIASFWLVPDHRHTSSWRERRDMNDVMLATILAPDGFLTLAPPRGTPLQPLPRPYARAGQAAPP